MPYIEICQPLKQHHKHVSLLFLNCISRESSVWLMHLLFYIRDANIPASSIQKYLVQKLSLPSELEVRAISVIYDVYTTVYTQLIFFLRLLTCHRMCSSSNVHEFFTRPELFFRATVTPELLPLNNILHKEMPGQYCLSPVRVSSSEHVHLSE